MLFDSVNGKKIVPVIPLAARNDAAAADLDHVNGGNLGNLVALLCVVGAEGNALTDDNKITLTLTRGDAAAPETPVSLADVVVPAGAAAGVVHAPDGEGVVMTFDADGEVPGAFLVGLRHNKRFTRAALAYEGVHAGETVTGLYAIFEDLAFQPAA